MRGIVRKERPHPGAQLRLTDLGGHRFTCFATSTRRGWLLRLLACYAPTPSLTASSCSLAPE
jgi:hypothetical protein